jgi:diaminopimelate decarboxylase
MSKAKLYLQYENGILVLGPAKKSLNAVTKGYQRPTYIYDLDILRERYRLLSEALPTAQIYYAMKANSNPRVLQTLRELGAGVDVVSGGEIGRAAESGFAPGEMIYSGVGKTVRELGAAIESEIRQLNVESISELSRIASIARELGRKARVVFRLNPDISIETHPYIATGLHNNKFGMALSDLPALKAVLQAEREHLELRGISLHLGSQMHQLGGFREALRILRPVYESLQKEFPTVTTFDIGGGLGIFYETMDIAGEEALLGEYAAIVHEELHGLRMELQTEPGRWLVGHAGVLLSQIQYLKKTSAKNFIILDTGMHHLLRPALYQAVHEILPLFRRTLAPEKLYDVVGPICESGDFLGHDRRMNEVEEGDFLVIADTGAYGYTMRSDYNLQAPPDEVFL